MLPHSSEAATPGDAPVTPAKAGVQLEMLPSLQRKLESRFLPALVGNHVLTKHVRRVLPIALRQRCSLTSYEYPPLRRCVAAKCRFKYCPQLLPI